MRTVHSRNSTRRHRGDYGRDEFSRSGMEDSMRNEDYYFNEPAPGDGFYNRDYNDGNYWAQRDDVRDERMGSTTDYVPAADYGYRRRYGRFETSGYGNQASPQMRDFERWRDQSEDQGYQGRNSYDYRGDYGRNSYYDPSDYNRGGYRRNAQSEYHNDYNNESRWYERDDYGYGDYQSYPPYEARGYRPREYDARNSARFRNGGRGEREFGRAHRPYIREKRY